MITVATEADLLQWLKKNKNLFLNKVVRLHGSMGAGKTTLVRLYLSLFSQAEVASPTFSVHHQYQTSAGVVDHMDLFRLENPEELDQAGLWEILKNSSTVFIEWPERVPSASWPQNRSYVDVFIEVKDSSRLLRWLSL